MVNDVMRMCTLVLLRNIVVCAMTVTRCQHCISSTSRWSTRYLMTGSSTIGNHEGVPFDSQADETPRCPSLPCKRVYAYYVYMYGEREEGRVCSGSEGSCGVGC